MLRFILAFIPCLALLGQENIEWEWTPENLNIAYWYHLDDTLHLDSLVYFETITEATFNELKKQHVEFITVDSTKFKKEEDTLFLKTAKGDTLLVDAPEEMEDAMCVHHYVGEMDVLNQYLVMSELYESSEVDLINQDTGERTRSFSGIPNISKDTTYLLELLANPYDENTDFGLFKIEEDSLSFLFAATYLQWMPNAVIDSVYWVSDTSFILKATPSQRYWTNEGFYNESYQCIKGTLLKDD